MLRAGLDLIADHLRHAAWDTTTPKPWDDLWLWGQRMLPVDVQEALLSLMLEPHGPLVDDLAGCLSEDETPSIALDGAMTAKELLTLLTQNYAWALQDDYTQAAQCARFWYMS